MPSITSITTPPVHSASCLRKLFHNHSASGFSPSITVFRNFNAALNRSRKAGSRSSIVHFARGTKRLCHAHSKPSKSFFVIGSSAFLNRSKASASGLKSMFLRGSISSLILSTIAWILGEIVSSTSVLAVISISGISKAPSSISTDGMLIDPPFPPMFPALLA